MLCFFLGGGHDISVGYWGCGSFGDLKSNENAGNESLGSACLEQMMKLLSTCNVKLGARALQSQRTFCFSVFTVVKAGFLTGLQGGSSCSRDPPPIWTVGGITCMHVVRNILRKFSGHLANRVVVTVGEGKSW